MRLFSYCLPVDDGAAPNPYWGTCTLAICKPKIRSVAKIGDWIAGVGSVNVRGKSYRNKLVYAMKVTNKMTMKEYDDYCLKYLPKKVPDINNNDYRLNVGDSIYDYSQSEPKLRDSVHNCLNRERDLNGKNVLLSNHFYYFGDNAIDLPKRLWPIIKQGQAHKSDANELYKLDFVDWLEKTPYDPNQLHGKPQIVLDFKHRHLQNCSSKC
ncbi:hypothetical protein [Maribacter sp. 1_MG-2023]|uniref:Nmad2 family putative nucleotide modification protein n=1 Tax=Maribacter sp. 1_MG-2023 TaxID=3062677 RepID=UPI0026E38E4E|nr:hypothetical protein [Maribacter sp. 1_MG-2023]MDO6470237.1 hypothetical protein [Maribacter sp. 1_MG-2023]